MFAVRAVCLVVLWIACVQSAFAVGDCATPVTISSSSTISFTGVSQIGNPFSVSNTAGDITVINSTLSACTGTMSLHAANSIAEDAASSLTAATLTGQSMGNTSLIGTNQIGMLDTFASFGSFVFNDNLPITQSSSSGHSLTMFAASTFDAGPNAITLDNAGNIFIGAVTFSGSNVKLTNSTATGFNASTANGTLDVISNGAISQLGTLTVTGASSFNAGANAITLTNASNDFTGAVTATGAGVSITGVNGLTVADINAGASTVALRSGSNITQPSGVITANTLTGNASGGVLLGSVGNQITNLGDFSANGFSLDNAQPLAVTGAVNSTGALALDASLVNVTNTGSLTFGNSATVGNVIGNYSQTGTLNLHATSSSNDLLAIAGTAGLGGILSVAFSSQPSAGQFFTVVTASSIGGTFGTVNVTGLGAAQSASVTYNATSVVLTINATTPVTLQAFEVD